MKIYPYILGFMAVGYILYWLLAIIGFIPIADSNINEFAFEWSFSIMDPLIGIFYLISLLFYKRKHSYWKILLTVTFSVSIGINFFTMIYWILLKKYFLPTWFMAIFVFLYSLIGIIIINKEEVTEKESANIYNEV